MTAALAIGGLLAILFISVAVVLIIASPVVFMMWLLYGDK